MGIFDLFKKKKTYQDQLKRIYEEKGYKNIPVLPNEEECRRIVESYKVFNSSTVNKQYMEETFQDGLLRGEIVLLWWLNNPRTNKNKVPKYFMFDYGIDTILGINKLFNLNYIDSDNILTDKGKELLKDNELLIKQHRMKKVYKSDGTIQYLESSILKGEEREIALHKEVIQQIEESLKNMKENGVKQYIIIGSKKEHDNKIYEVEHAIIGENCPPFYIGDTSAISPYVDREAFERSLRERGL